MRVWVKGAATSFASAAAFVIGNRPCWAFSSTAGEDPLGPPRLLMDLKISDPPLRAYRRTPGGRESHSFFIQRTSYEPDSYLLRGFLRPNECRQIMEEEKEMEQAQTADGGTSARKVCRVGWLNNSKIGGLVGSLAAAAGNLLLSKPPAGCEDLQVLDYGEGGEYTLHHDSNDRVLTVLYYLNGEGGTWFPLARIVDVPHEARTGEKLEPSTREEALQMADQHSVGLDGLLLCGGAHSNYADRKGIVDVQAGDAVAFFNYDTDVLTGEKRPIWRAIHAGVPATSRKWIANHWYHCVISPEVENE